MTKTELSFLLSAIYVYERKTDAVSPVEVEAWYQLLAEVDFEDAKHVVTDYFADSDRPLSPARIRAGVRLLADRRNPPGTVAEKTLLPDADPDEPAAYIQAMREHRWVPVRDSEDFPQKALDTSGVGREVPPVSAGEIQDETPRPRRWWLFRGKDQKPEEQRE